MTAFVHTVLSNPLYYGFIVLELICGCWLSIHPFTSFNASFFDGILLPLFRYGFGISIILMSTKYGNIFRQIYVFYSTLNGRALSLFFLGSLCADETSFGTFVTWFVLLVAVIYHVIWIINKYLYTFKLPPPFGYYNFLDENIMNGNMKLSFIQHIKVDGEGPIRIEPEIFNISIASLQKCKGEIPTIDLQTEYLEDAEEYLQEDGNESIHKKFTKLGIKDKRKFIKPGSAKDSTMIVDHDVPFHLPLSGICWQVIKNWPHKSGKWVGSCSYIQYRFYERVFNDENDEYVGMDDEVKPGQLINDFGISFYLTCAHNVVDTIKNGDEYVHVAAKNVSIFSKDKNLQIPIEQFWYHPRYIRRQHGKIMGKNKNYDLAILMTKSHIPNEHYSYSGKEVLGAYSMGIDIGYIQQTSGYTTKPGCVYGYPCEKHGELWGMKGSLIYDDDNPEQIEYTSIHTTGGQSGSPIIQFTGNSSNQSQYIVGVHTWGRWKEVRNGGCRITKEKFDWIQRKVHMAINYYGGYVEV